MFLGHFTSPPPFIATSRLFHFRIFPTPLPTTTTPIIFRIGEHAPLLLVEFCFILFDSRLKADRARQEQLAKERLERMKAKRGAKKEKVELVTEGDEGALRDALIRHIEHRHSLEREVCSAVLSKPLLLSA